MKKEDKSLFFGRGFRKVVPSMSIKGYFALAPKEVVPSIDVTESFRFEKVDSSRNSACRVRVRSDVSMLLHAADTAKKIGAAGMQYLMESKRTKVSSVQSSLDALNPSDDELLAMVKSRHLQHPSEILAFVESINELADEMKSEALRAIEDEKVVSSTSVIDDPAGSSSSAES